MMIISQKNQNTHRQAAGHFDDLRHTQRQVIQVCTRAGIHATTLLLLVLLLLVPFRFDVVDSSLQIRDYSRVSAAQVGDVRHAQLVAHVSGSIANGVVVFLLLVEELANSRIVHRGRGHTKEGCHGGDGEEVRRRWRDMSRWLRNG